MVPMEQRIVVTGASSGIGRAVVRHATRRGWRVLAVARREERLASLAQETGCDVLVADLTDADAVARLVAAAEAFDANALVHVAGGALGIGTVPETTLEDWQGMFDANVVSTKRVLTGLLPQLRRSTAGGAYASIQVVTSIAASVPYAGGSGYNAAKAAEKALVDVLRLELHGEPIRVMEVQPGMVRTEEFSLVRFGGDQARADAVYEGVQDPLSADDVAQVMTDVLALPGHVSIDQVVIKPVAQTHPWMVHRGPLQAKG
ncbi:SDR family oxidoreductase [Agrococcus versicolor]|uniref:SDR family oxidoreductase n=2 Tax=Agrococcus versicolor TaxID=501482 RepID=A0ABN3AP30_9MICO